MSTVSPSAIRSQALNTLHIWLALCAAILAGATGTLMACSGASEPIVIGHYASMTGTEATFGVSTDNGIKLALREFNAAGGLKGREVKLITYDDQGKADEAVKCVTRLIAQD